jgi:ParB/RepB/Spo0J family partition protein
VGFGARRFRATLWAKVEAIPAFIDDSVDDYDQVAENLQREGLSPMEYAILIIADGSEALLTQTRAPHIGEVNSAVFWL